MSKKVVSKKKDMKIEDLARMMQGEFIVIHKRFDGVDKRFDGVDKRFDGVDGELRLVRGRLDAIEMELIDIKKKLNNVVHRHEFELLKERIEKLEKKLGVK